MSHHILQEHLFIIVCQFDQLCALVFYPLMILHAVSNVLARTTPYLLCRVQDEGDYLCVKVLRHSKSKKTMVSQRLRVAG